MVQPKNTNEGMGGERYRTALARAIAPDEEERERILREYARPAR